jgi:hypothetical protein
MRLSINKNSRVRLETGTKDRPDHDFNRIQRGRQDDYSRSICQRSVLLHTPSQWQLDGAIADTVFDVAVPPAAKFTTK